MPAQTSSPLPQQPSSSLYESNLAAVRGLAPAPVWKNFVDFCDIPVEELKEEPVRQYLIRFAQEHGLEFGQDSTGNFAVYIPGRGAGADKSPVTLQFHMDMVLEPANHDFQKLGISLQREERQLKGEIHEVISSGGTSTIGADNRMAGALIKAAAVDPELTDCPPLVLLATWGEETGLKGAKVLDPKLLRGSTTLINLDNEVIGEILNACAGQATFEIDIPLERTASQAGAVPVIISLRDFPSGHSGIEIAAQRGNALKDLLHEFADYMDQHAGSSIQIASITGGAKRNSIPHEAAILVWASSDDAMDLVRHFGDQEVKSMFRDKIAANIREEESKEPKVEARIEEDVLVAGSLKGPLETQIGQGLLKFLLSVPHGVAEWDGDPALQRPALSNNFAIVQTGDSSLKLTCMSRHVNGDTAESYLYGELSEAADLLIKTPDIRCTGKSSGWDGAKDNSLIEEMREAYRVVLGREPIVTSIHAGIECGEFAILVPGIQQGSSGPTIIGAHTNKEAVLTATVPVAYDFLKETLRRLAVK